MRICFLTKIEKSGVKDAIAFTKNITKDIDIFYGESFDPFPEEVKKPPSGGYSNSPFGHLKMKTVSKNRT